MKVRLVACSLISNSAIVFGFYRAAAALLHNPCYVLLTLVDYQNQRYACCD